MSNGESFFDQLLKAYKTFGLYQEKLISFVKKGKQGVLEIQQMMENLRKSPPEHIGGVRIKTIEDFKVGIQHNCIDDKKEIITLPKSDVLIFTTEDGAKVAVRPSGTEPKIKFYFSVNSPLTKQSEYDHIRSSLIAKINRMCGELGLTA
jgi:phosphoglucomutase